MLALWVVHMATEASFHCGKGLLSASLVSKAWPAGCKDRPLKGLDAVACA